MLLDQRFRQHRFELAIELPGQHLLPQPRLQRSQQAPAMQLAVEQDYQDMKDKRLEGQQVTRIARHRAIIVTVCDYV